MFAVFSPSCCMNVPSVLEPRFYLRLGEVETSREIDALTHTQIFVVLKCNKSKTA